MQLLADGNCGSPFVQDGFLIMNTEKLKCPVDSIYPFMDVLKAFDRIQTGKASGKVIVTVP